MQNIKFDFLTVKVHVHRINLPKFRNVQIHVMCRMTGNRNCSGVTKRKVPNASIPNTLHQKYHLQARHVQHRPILLFLARVTQPFYSTLPAYMYTPDALSARLAKVT